MNSSIPALLLLAAAFLPAPSSAAESYDGCKYQVAALPATLTSQGVWCLTGDLSTSIASGAAVIIAANNVTLDCNGYKLGGLAAGAGTTTTGISFNARTNVTVRNCSVRGFYRGLYAVDASDATIEDNVFSSNTYTGIYLQGSIGSVVRRNRISDTGGTTNTQFNTYALRLENDFDVIDNLIVGVYPDSLTEGGTTYGMYTAGGSGTITGNRIRGLFPTSTGVGAGIYNAVSTRLSIDRNYISFEGVTTAMGVRCGSSAAVSSNNHLLGVSTGVTNCTSVGDIVDTD